MPRKGFDGGGKLISLKPLIREFCGNWFCSTRSDRGTLGPEILIICSRAGGDRWFVNRPTIIRRIHTRDYTSTRWAGHNTLYRDQFSLIFSSFDYCNKGSQRFTGGFRLSIRVGVLRIFAVSSATCCSLANLSLSNCLLTSSSCFL